MANPLIRSRTCSMRPTDLPYLNRTRAKGRDYWYVRYKGTNIAKLPGEPGSREFLQAYAEARRQIDGDPAPREFSRGTVGWLLQSYKASPDFLKLKSTTRSDYSRMIDLLRPIDSRPASDVTREHINLIRNKALAGKSRSQQLFASVVSAVWSWGNRELSLSLTNPAQLMRRAEPSVPYRPWKDSEIEAFEASTPPQWLMTAYMLAKYSGARRGDVVKLMRSDREDGGLCVSGSKTENPIWVPEHPDLTAYLDGLPPTLFLVADDKGRPVRADRVSKALKAHAREIGLPDDLVLHGLRHTAGKSLAEAGCPAHEIAAVLGHETLQMVQHYTKRANQKRLARSAIDRLRNKD